MAIALNKILFFDLKTVRAAKSLQDLQASEKGFWGEKAAYLREKYEHYKNMSDQALYEERAALYPEFGQVFTVALGYLQEQEGAWSLKSKILFNREEDFLLQEAIKDLAGLARLPVEGLGGHNLRRFDIPYFARRCLVHGLQVPSMLYDEHRKPWDDYYQDNLNLWSFGGKSSVSLHHLATLLGIEQAGEWVSPKAASAAFYEAKNKDAILENAEQDLLLTVQVYLKIRAPQVFEKLNK